MGYRKSPSIEFDSKPTIDEMIAALTELKEDHGGTAFVRVRGFIGSAFDSGGPFVKAISVVPAEQPEGTEGQ